MNLTKNQSKYFEKLFGQMKKWTETSEKCLGYLFYYGPYSKYPILPIIEKWSSEKNIVLFFGEEDWIDYKLTLKKIKENDIKVNCHIIEDCGHQMVFQKPFEISKLIILDLKNQQNKQDKEKEQEEFDHSIFEKKRYKCIRTKFSSNTKFNRIQFDFNKP